MILHLQIYTESLDSQWALYINLAQRPRRRAAVSTVYGLVWQGAAAVLVLSEGCRVAADAAPRKALLMRLHLYVAIVVSP